MRLLLSLAVVVLFALPVRAERITAESTVDAIIANINHHATQRQPLKLGDWAKREPGMSAQYSVLLEGVRLFYELHAAELSLRAANEQHTSKYLRWMRARDHEELGKESQVNVAVKLGEAEASRLAFFRERTKYILLRDRFVEMTGLTLPDEMIDPPKAPNVKPPDLLADDLLAAAGKAKASAKVKRRVFAETLYIGEAWQRLVAAKATYEGANAELLYVQQLYANERVTSVGSVMHAVSKAEAELIRATGELAVRAYRLAILLGHEEDDPLELTRNGLAPNFLFKLTGQEMDGDAGDYVPRSGTGYGQNEDDSLLPQ